MKLTIGQVSKLFDISSDTLRYYDKINILKPQVDSNNGYRYYFLQDLEKLGLILGIKDLGASLSNIHSTIQSEDLSTYKTLLLEQEEMIQNKIQELKILQKKLFESQKLIDKIIDFKNTYDFSTLNPISLDLKLFGVNISKIISLTSTSSYEDLSLFNEESYLYPFNVLDKDIIYENENLVFIKKTRSISKLIKKYSNLGVIFTPLSLKGTFIQIDFYGTVFEASNYMLSLNNYFNKGKKNNIYVTYDFYLPSNTQDSKYFINIFLEILN